MLLSAVWVVGAVFADRNVPALGGILNQQGVGNSTVRLLTSQWRKWENENELWVKVCENEKWEISLESTKFENRNEK